MIHLVADVSDIKGSPDNPLSAAVIETTKNSQHGVLVSVVVKQGKISPGDTIFSQSQSAKVKALINYLGNHVSSVGPGEPALPTVETASATPPGSEPAPGNPSFPGCICTGNCRSFPSAEARSRGGPSGPVSPP